MGNAAKLTIEGKGNVILKITSKKQLAIKDVLCVSEISKNLISGPLLIKHGFLPCI